MRNFNQHGVLYGITPKVCMEFCAAGMESTHGVVFLGFAWDSSPTGE